MKQQVLNLFAQAQQETAKSDYAGSAPIMRLVCQAMGVVSLQQLDLGPQPDLPPVQSLLALEARVEGLINIYVGARCVLLRAGLGAHTTYSTQQGAAYTASLLSCHLHRDASCGTTLTAIELPLPSPPPTPSPAPSLTWHSPALLPLPQGRGHPE